MNTQVTPLRSLFKKGQSYSIPNFKDVPHNTYRWDVTDQCTQFWQDIVTSVTNPQRHFLGAIMLTAGPAHSIVDGTQRIYTTAILLAALREVYRKTCPQTAQGITVDLIDCIHASTTNGDDLAMRAVLSGNHRSVPKRQRIGKAYHYFVKAIQTECTNRGTAFIPYLLAGLDLHVQYMHVELAPNDNPEAVYNSLPLRGLIRA